MSKAWVQLELDFNRRILSKKNGTRVRSGEYALAEGMFLISQLPDPSQRLRLFARGDITCVKCGIVGKTFYMEKNINDLVAKPHLTLYGVNAEGEEVMMTWDHIVPRSIGGSNSLSNAQCMCTECNGTKGNNLTLGEIVNICTNDKVLEMFKPVEPINFTKKVSGSVVNTIGCELKYSTNLFRELKNIRKAMLKGTNKAATSPAC